MTYRDKILTYFFVRSAIFDFLALRRLIMHVVGNVLAVLCFVVWLAQHPSDDWHPHRPFFLMSDAQIVETYRAHPAYQDYANYVHEHHLLGQPPPAPVWHAPGIAAMAATLSAPNHPQPLAPLSHDEILQLILITADALDRAAPERHKIIDKGSTHTEAWFLQTEALQRHLTSLYEATR